MLAKQRLKMTSVVCNNTGELKELWLKFKNQSVKRFTDTAVD